MPDKTQQKSLDQDQEYILAVYSFYTDEAEHTFLQYTAACAVFYYLTKEGFFEYNLDELLVYDYKESRRYIWEAKKFMADINILRDHGYLIRVRSRSKTYRDVNAHQCSVAGHAYIKNRQKNDSGFSKKTGEIKKALSCSKGHLFEVHLEDAGPQLVCERNIKECVRVVPIEGFLKDLTVDEKSITPGTESKYKQYEPFFI